MVGWFEQGAGPLLIGQTRLQPDSNPTPNRPEYARPRLLVARVNIEHLSSDARGEPSLAAEAEGTNAEGEYVRVRNGY